MNPYQVTSANVPSGKMDHKQSFWRHRADCDYLVKGNNIYRMGDGLLAFVSPGKRSRDALIKRLESGRRPMRVKVLASYPNGFQPIFSAANKGMTPVTTWANLGQP